MSRLELKRLLNEGGCSPKKMLGQNFLCDVGTVEKIVKLANLQANDEVVEVGPGVGSLTLGLCAQGAQVKAVEIDSKLVEILNKVLDSRDLTNQVEIFNEDIMKTEWGFLTTNQKYKLIANLPYNISIPLVIEILAKQPHIEFLLIMVQKEAGERLVAGPGSKIYGVPSLLVSFWADARIVGSVKPNVFFPRPKVDSVLVKIERHRKYSSDIYDHFSHLVKDAFNQRRKMIRRSLAKTIQLDDFEQVGIKPTQRPEELDLASWVNLAKETG